MVGGGDDDNETAHARDGRSRPHWWAVLAVALALMALLAAASAGRSSGVGARSARETERSSSHASARTGRHPTPPAHAGPTTTTTLATATAATATAGSGKNTAAPTLQADHANSAPRSEGTAATGAAGTAPSPQASAAAAGSTSDPVAATTTTTTTTPSSGAAGSSTPAVPEAHGSVASPAFTSQSFGFVVDTQSEVVATWTPSALMTLTVTCPSGTQTGYGTSSAAVLVPDLTGTCEASLSENAAQPITVSYTLSLEPVAGG